jgi:hypothetical protein
LDRKLSGTLEAPSSYFMKSPPIQHHDDVARDITEKFILGEFNGVVKPDTAHGLTDTPSVPKKK